MPSIAENPFVLVDGSSYLHRAFHACPPFTNTQGQPTGAIYGVLNMLKSLIEMTQSQRFVVVFDAKGKTFRHELFDDYKATRAKMPDELRQQIAPLHQVIQALGIPLIAIPGVEADDVIGTLAKKASQQGEKVLISTGDKDMAQLVDENIMLINTMDDNRLLDIEGVIEKFGVEPNKIIDYLALKGDSSDNIPGVPGIGDKTAIPMLNDIGDLKTIYANLNQLATLSVRGAKKLAEKMQEHREAAELSYQLATIKTDVDLDLSEDFAFLKTPNFAELIELFTTLEFKNWLADAQNGSLFSKEKKALETKPAKATAKKTVKKTASTLGISPLDPAKEIHLTPENYQIVLNQKVFDKTLESLHQTGKFSLFVVTDNAHYLEATIFGLGLSTKEENFYLPFRHDYLGVPTQLEEEQVLTQLAPLLTDKNFPKIGADLKTLMHLFAHRGIALQGVEDPTVMSYVLDSTAKHNVENLAEKYFGLSPLSIEEILGKGRNKLTFNQVDIEKACRYVAERAELCWHLAEYFQQNLQSRPELLKLYQQVEAPLVPVLQAMEQEGVAIQSEDFFEQAQNIQTALNQLEEKAFLLAGETFNLASNKQLQEILFEKLGLPVLKKTPKGAPSCNEEVLSELAESHELPQIVLTHRSLSKLKSTYLDALPLLVNEHSQRIHTTYHQTVTSTGRLSSSEPNLQSIPIRSEEGRRIRQGFIPRTGFKLMAADYSQIELRIMAHLSQDENLVKAFLSGKDIHKATAAEMFDVPLDEVTSTQRRNAKAINFGLIYGMSTFGLAKQLGISMQDAKFAIERYFSRYPAVKTFMQQAPSEGAKKGFVETLFQRRLYIPALTATNQIARKAGERLAINAPMQGTAADIIKRAMLDIHQEIKEEDGIKMIMQVHDELVFEVREEEIAHWRERIKTLMENAVKLSVPLVVDVGVGDNWEEAH